VFFLPGVPSSLVFVNFLFLGIWRGAARRAFVSRRSRKVTWPRHIRSSVVTAAVELFPFRLSHLPSSVFFFEDKEQFLFFLTVLPRPNDPPLCFFLRPSEASQRDSPSLSSNLLSSCLLLASHDRLSRASYEPNSG